MYSKAEKQALIQEFWTTFGQNYPRKWLLHKTKIKDVHFKFYADNKKVGVCLEIGCKSEDLKKIYYEKIISLFSLLKDEFLPNIKEEYHHLLENGKEVALFWEESNQWSMHNKQHWEEIFDYFYDKMDAFERFFFEYEDYIRDLETNT
ncbi:MAG: DUF4268 domain-containing protein [Flavobacterium sp.]